MTEPTPTEIHKAACDALQRFVSGKPVLNSPAGPDSDDIKIQKALVLLNDLIQESKLSTFTNKERYGKEL